MIHAIDTIQNNQKPDNTFENYLRGRVKSLVTLIALNKNWGNIHMAELIDNPTVISAEEALKTEIILNQALIDILIAKKIISEDELLKGIKKIKREREIIANDWDSLI
jgi:hypothetical protein